MNDLPAATHRKLAAIAKNIAKAKGDHIASAFRIAVELDKAHEELARHGNGTFGAWVESECGFTLRTAENYRSLLTIGDEKVRESLSQSCTLEALYYLARDKTPEDVIEAVVERAEAGEHVGIKAVKAIEAEVVPVADDEPECTPPEPDAIDEPETLQSFVDPLPDEPDTVQAFADEPTNDPDPLDMAAVDAFDAAPNKLSVLRACIDSLPSPSRLVVAGWFQGDA